MPFFTGPLPVQSAAGRRPGSLADATQDCSTLEEFSPRTVLTKNICRCVQHILQHIPTTKPFLTVSAMTYSWMASTAPQADSWWLGHVEPDDVVIADIAGQALDIFLHGPESAHKNGFAKTFTQTSIPIHPCTLLKKCKNNNSKMLNSPNFLNWSSSCAVCWWPIFRKLGTCSTTDALSPRTLLTENICESVYQILQHGPAEKKDRKKPLNSSNMMPFFTGPLPVQSAAGRRPGSLADATQDCSTSEDFSPKTVLTKNICRCVHHMLQYFPTTMPFLTVSAITYSWMASTAPQADSWWLGHV